MSQEKKLPVPKWLEELQQRSWEPEILLSGIVLYGMFKVPELLDAYSLYFKLNVFGNLSDADNLVALFKMGIYWLITGLILHLICRGIWIGMVGLSYVFPKGIRVDKLHYQQKFHDKVSRIASFEEIVIRLEKISSSLFSISFMLFMSLIGGYLYLFLLVVVPFTFSWVFLEMDLTGPFYTYFQYYVIIMFVLGMLGLIDFVTLGYFRRFKWIAKLYWPLHRFISALTLSRFYRPIYYGMISNFNRWVLFFGFLLFTFVSISGAGSISETGYSGDAFSRLSFWRLSGNYSVFSGNYDDQNEEKPSVRASIPSDVIHDDVLRLFVVANIAYEDNMEEHMSLDSLREVYPDTSKTALMHMVVKSFFTVKVDGRLVPLEQWYFHYKTSTAQRGYLAYIDISLLKQGMHEVAVFGPENFYKGSPFSTIPFYRDALDPRVEYSIPDKEEEKRPDFQPKPFGIRD